MEYYHVISQSHIGRNIFPTEEDCLVYLQLVKRACQKYQIHWLAYAIMPTHTHLIFAVEGGGPARLTKARHNITYGYTTYAHKQYPALYYKDKQVFFRKNTVKILQTAYDVKHCIRYLHNNPREKGLEAVAGQTIRSSYCAILSFLEPENAENPFLHFIELREIRDALALEEACRIFGRNRNEQRQAFLSYHAASLPNALPDALQSSDTHKKADKAQALQKAEAILQNGFSQIRAFQGKPFDDDNRQAFLFWLNRRGSKYRATLIVQLAVNTSLSTREIATFLNTSSTTVKRIIAQSKK